MTSSDRKPIRNKILVGVVMLLFAATAYLAWKNWDRGPNVRASTDRHAICADCGYSFVYVIRAGDAEPYKCEKCGKHAAWLAEPCYWTKEGKAKKYPTWVLVKKRMGLDEETLCPDCGRRVVGHNPLPPPELRQAAEAGTGS